MKPKLDFDFFEIIMMNYCLNNSSYFSAISEIATPEYFGNKDCKLIYALLKAFYEKKSRLPSDIELQSYLSNDRLRDAFLNVQTAIRHFSGNYDDDVLLENTETFLKERGFALTLEETVKNYNDIDLSKDSEEIVEKFNKVCNIKLNTELGMDYFKDLPKFTERISEQEDHISTGFSWLDKKIGGGYRKKGKALYIFSGAPNSGKSILLGNSAVNFLKQNKTVILISLEMSEDVYATRISSQLSKIPLSTLHTSTETLLNFCNDFTNVNNQARLIIKEFANNSIKVSGIKNYINDLQKRLGITPDVIILDYVNILQYSTNTGSSYQDVKKTVEDLRAISYHFQCPVITATQLSRDAMNKEDPGLETTSESYGTASTADVQVSVFSKVEDREIGLINLGIQRNRYGQNFGTKALRIDWETLYVEQFEEDDDDGFEDDDDLISSVEDSLRALK